MGKWTGEVENLQSDLFMQIKSLDVVIRRSPVSRNLSARVTQQAADMLKIGCNLIGKTTIRRIETAKKKVSKKLDSVSEINFVVEAEPDLKRKGRPKKPVVDPKDLSEF